MYKPPTSELYTISLPLGPAPAIYPGDFNCHHTDRAYKHTKHGETLTDGHALLKQCYCITQRSPRASSICTIEHIYQDLTLAVGRSCDPKPERRIIDIFPRSHQRPSISKVPLLVELIARKPVKRWNVRKAISELFTAETERRTPGLPNPQADDATYTVYCNMLICAAKNNNPRGFNKHYMGRQLQPPPSRAPAGHHQGRHRHNNNSATPYAG